MKYNLNRLINRVKIIFFGVNNVSKIFTAKTSFRILKYYQLYFDLIKRLRNDDGQFRTSGNFELSYPSIFSGGSSFFPKILGTYESELNAFFLNLKMYNEFIDIGCAEGYYVNGVAKKFGHIICSGYDINSKSIRFANLLKEHNTLNNSFFYLNKFDINHRFEIEGKKLVLIDIEGSEFEFANEEYANYFYNNKCDLIVEMHDFYGNLRITQNFLNSYSKKFEYQIIPSIDDILKVSTYKVNFDFINEYQKFMALRERGHSNHWLILKNKDA